MPFRKERGYSHIWAPWRVEYILKKKDSSCFLCEASNSSEDRSNLVLKRGRHSFIILNRYPYNPGHLMVATKRHEGRIEGLDDDELYEMVDLMRYSILLLKEAMNPQGFNTGINIGEVAGAGAPDHLHIHIVPRWKGDTNFMPIIGSVKVIPEHLINTYDKLMDLIQNGRFEKIKSS